MCISYFSVIEFFKRMIFQESCAGKTPQRVAQIPKTTGTSRGWCSTSPSEEVQDRCREEIRGVVMVVVTLEAIQTELRILVLLCLLVTLLYLYFSHQEIYEMEIFLDPVYIS